MSKKEKIKEEKMEEKAAPQQPEQVEQTPEERIAELENRVAELEDIRLRQMAEFDNYRRRTNKEKLELLETAGERIFKEMGEKLGYKLTPHILRHTSATLALQNGMDITQVQKMLGHSSVNTTQIYAETSQEEVAISHKKYVI